MEVTDSEATLEVEHVEVCLDQNILPSPHGLLELKMVLMSQWIAVWACDDKVLYVRRQSPQSKLVPLFHSHIH